MADKKKQHCVPQFYLKLFSNGEPVINVFNVNAGPIPKPAAIKSQCCEDYFYGKENLATDDALTGLENIVAPMLKEVIEKRQLPDKQSKEYIHILYFILLQHNRTKHSGEEYNEETNKILKIMARDRPDVLSAFEHWRVVDKHPTAIPLYAVTTMWVFAVDLDPKIIWNSSEELFITSDNPVVYYNQYMENCTTESSTGLGSKGLQIFFPISPRIMIHLYDPGVYRVGPGKEGFCEVYSDAEARKINELQWLNALENIYYSNEVSQDSISAQARRSSPRRRSDLVKITEHEHPTDNSRSLLHIQRVDLKTRLQPSFIKIKKSMKKIPLDKRERVRSPYLMIARHEFEKQVEEGKYRDEEFLKFLADLETGRVKVQGL